MAMTCRLRLTDRAERVIAFAQAEAKGHRARITELNILRGVSNLGQGVAFTALERLGCDPKKFLDPVEQPFANETLLAGDSDPAIESALAITLRIAEGEADVLCHNYIGTEHLLLGIFAISESPVSRALCEHGVTRQILREQVSIQLRGTGSVATH